MRAHGVARDRMNMRAKIMASRTMVTQLASRKTIQKTAAAAIQKDEAVVDTNLRQLKDKFIGD